jgi:hypothetical protein
MLVIQINHPVEEVIPLSVAMTIIMTIVHTIIILVVAAVVVQVIIIIILAAVAVIILREEHHCVTAESVRWKWMNCARVVVMLCVTVIL